MSLESLLTNAEFTLYRNCWNWSAARRQLIWKVTAQRSAVLRLWTIAYCSPGTDLSSASSVQLSTSQRIPLCNRSDGKGHGANARKGLNVQSSEQRQYLAQATKAFSLTSSVPLGCADLNLRFFLCMCDETTHVNDCTTRIVNSWASSYVCLPSAAADGLTGAWAPKYLSSDPAFLRMSG